MALKQISFAEFAAFRNRLAELLTGAAEVFSVIDRRPRAEAIRNVRDVLLEDRFRIVIMGAFKDGKSTLINALLGEDLLPTKASIACTAIPISVRAGEPLRAICHKRSGSEPLVCPLPAQLKDFFEAVTIPPRHQRVGLASDATARKMHPYTHAEMFAPNELLKNGVELQDSPGLNEDDERSDTAWGQVKEADAVVAVLNIREINRSTDRKDLGDVLQEECDSRIVFAVWNQIDSCRDNPVDYEGIQNEAIAMVVTAGIFREHVFFVSALEGLEGRRKKDKALVAASGIEDFEIALSTFLVNRNSAKLLKPLRRAGEALRDARANVDTWRNRVWIQVTQAEHAEKEARKVYVRASAITSSFSVSAAKSTKLLHLEIEQSSKAFVESLIANVSEPVERISLTAWDVIFSPRASKEQLTASAKTWISERITAWEKGDLERLLNDNQGKLNDEWVATVGELESLTAEIATHELAALTMANKIQRGNTAEEESHQGGSKVGGVSISDPPDISPAGRLAGGAIFGGLIGAGLALISGVIVVALVGAVLGAVAGGSSLPWALKNLVIERARKSLQAETDDLERRIRETVDQAWSKFCGDANDLVNARFRIIEQIMANVERVCTNAKEIGSTHGARADELLEQLDKYGDELDSLEREIDPLKNPEHMVEGVSRRLAPEFKAMNDSLQAVGGSGSKEREPSLTGLRAIIGEDGYARLKAVQAVLEKLGKWKPAMERQLLVAWADCKNNVNEKAEAQEPAFRAVSAIAISEGAVSFPDPNEVRRRYQEGPYRSLLIHICKVVLDDDYAAEFGSDPPGVVGSVGAKFVKAYMRALMKIEPERFKAQDEPGTIIDGKWHRDPPRHED